MEKSNDRHMGRGDRRGQRDKAKGGKYNCLRLVGKTPENKKVGLGTRNISPGRGPSYKEEEERKKIFYSSFTPLEIVWMMKKLPSMLLYNVKVCDT